MKKLILSACAAMAIFCVSCSSNESKVASLMNDTAAKYEKAKTAEEIEKITTKFAADALKLVADMGPEEAAKLDDSEKIKEADKAMTKALEDAVNRVSGAE